jgi:hypothetical protein
LPSHGPMRRGRERWGISCCPGSTYARGFPVHARRETRSPSADHLRQVAHERVVCERLDQTGRRRIAVTKVTQVPRTRRPARSTSFEVPSERLVRTATAGDDTLAFVIATRISHADPQIVLVQVSPE